jgi:hypothetical protein
MNEYTAETCNLKTQWNVTHHWGSWQDYLFFGFVEAAPDNDTWCAFVESYVFQD